MCMWKGRQISGLILLFLAVYISLAQFFVRDHLGSKMWALIFFVFALCSIIAVLNDIKIKSSAVLEDKKMEDNLWDEEN
jgi:hypothetical protein